jgi:hypothetical protein
MVVDPFLFATSPLSPPSAIKIQIHPQSPKTAENVSEIHTYSTILLLLQLPLPSTA